MKKTIALLLSLVLMLGLLAGCGDSEPTATPASQETAAPTVSATEATEEATVAPTEESGPRIVTASALNKHDNGWYHNEEGTTEGVYFNLWTNDLPADETWSLRYTATADDNIALIRDGETIEDINCQILKFSNTEYFLVLDPWLVGEYGPMQAGDVLVLQGDFVDYDSGWGIRFDTTYITLKGENGAIFSTTPPESN